MGDVIWDFFSGAGGFSLGFAGKNNRVYGFDTNELALRTYNYNLSKIFKTAMGFCVDVTKLEFDIKYNKHYDSILVDVSAGDGNFLTTHKPDIIIGSPPCQGFSVANRFKNMDTTLVEKFLEIKDKVKPKYWVMEEVPAVGKIGKKEGWFEPRYLKACEFNLPQVRKRLFAGNYPPPTKKHYKGISVETPRAREPGTSWDGKFGKDKVIDRWNKMINTPQAEIRGYGHGKEEREKLKEMFVELGGMFPTPMTTGTDRDHTTRAKGLDGGPASRKKLSKFTDVITPELCAWVMGFPSWYKFFGNNHERYRQIGNAVCPPISKAIYEAILDPELTTRDIK